MANLGFIFGLSSLVLVLWISPCSSEDVRVTLAYITFTVKNKQYVDELADKTTQEYLTMKNEFKAGLDVVFGNKYEEKYLGIVQLTFSNANRTGWDNGIITNLTVMILDVSDNVKKADVEAAVEDLNAYSSLDSIDIEATIGDGLVDEKFIPPTDNPEIVTTNNKRELSTTDIGLIAMGCVLAVILISVAIGLTIYHQKRKTDPLQQIYNNQPYSRYPEKTGAPYYPRDARSPQYSGRRQYPSYF